MTPRRPVLIAFSLLVGLSSRLGAATPSASVGNLLDLLPRRVPVARVDGGQVFAVALGPSVVAGPYALKVPLAKGPLTLSLEAPVLEAGRFSSPARLRNGTGLPLSGLRLDVTAVSVVETTTGGQGRDLGDPGARPLWFGELGPGEESAPVVIEVDVSLPEGAKGTAVIRGVVTGVVVEDPGGAPDPKAVEEALRAYRGQPKTAVACPADLLEPVRGEGFGQAAAPIACRADGAGILWVVDGGKAIELFGSRAGFLRSLGPAAGGGAFDVAFGSRERVFVFEEGERPGSPVFVRTLHPF